VFNRAHVQRFLTPVTQRPSNAPRVLKPSKKLIFNLLKTGRRGIQISICNVLLRRKETEYYSSFSITLCCRKLEDTKTNSRIGQISTGSVVVSFLVFYGYLYQINGWIICTMKESLWTGDVCSITGILSKDMQSPLNFPGLAMSDLISPPTTGA